MAIAGNLKGAVSKRGFQGDLIRNSPRFHINGVRIHVAIAGNLKVVRLHVAIAGNVKRLLGY